MTILLIYFHKFTKFDKWCSGAALLRWVDGVHPVRSCGGHGLAGPQRRGYRPPDARRNQPRELGARHYPRRLRAAARAERDPRQRQPGQRGEGGRALVQ